MGSSEGREGGRGTEAGKEEEMEVREKSKKRGGRSLKCEVHHVMYIM